MSQSILTTVREAAGTLGVAPITVLDLYDEGRLAGEDVSGQVFIVRASLNAYAFDLIGARR